MLLPSDAPRFIATTGTLRALTTCCPASRRATDPSPTAWQQAWANEVYAQWRGDGDPPVYGPAACLNFGQVPFAPPSPETELCSNVPAYWPPGLAVLWALHVIDRIPSPRAFLKHAASALQPGGLLACSFAYWDAEGEDIALGHEQRTRIYSCRSWRELVLEELPRAGFQVLGPPDWKYRGDACGDHTIATAVGVRRSR